MEYKTDIPGYYKLNESVVINKDDAALAAYKKRKQKERKIDEVQNEVIELKNDVSEIKEMLKQILVAKG